MVKSVSQSPMRMNTLPANSNGYKSILQDCVEIQAGKLKGVFDPSQFGPGGRSLCITMPSKTVGDAARIVSPIEFEAMSDLAQCHAWKRSLRISSINKTLGQLLETGDLKLCVKKCICMLCRKSNDYMIKKRRASLTNKSSNFINDSSKATVNGQAQESLLLTKSIAKDRYYQTDFLPEYQNSYNSNNGIEIGLASNHNSNLNNEAHHTSKTRASLDVVIVNEIDEEPSNRLQFPPITSLLDSNLPSLSSTHLLMNGKSVKRELIGSAVPSKRNRRNSDQRETKNNLTHYTHGRQLNISQSPELSYPNLSITTELSSTETIVPSLTPLNGGCKDSDSDSGISNISSLSNRVLMKNVTRGIEESSSITPVIAQSSVANSTVSVLIHTSNAISRNEFEVSSHKQPNNGEDVDLPETTEMVETSFNGTDSHSNQIASYSNTNSIPDYTSMVREAITSISMAVPNNLDAIKDKDILVENSSRLMIILYILKKYKPSETINFVYTKVDTALALLERMGVIDKLKLRDANDSDSDVEEENSNEINLEQVQSPVHARSNEASGETPSGKKKLAKDVLKSNNSPLQKPSPKSVLSTLVTGDLREKLNAKRNSTSTESPTLSKAKITSRASPIPLTKEETNKVWVGTKTNRTIKVLNGTSKKPSEKILKIKKTKDKVKKSNSNSSDTKENQKAKANKTKSISTTNKIKQKSPVDKNGKTIRQFRLKRLSPELAAICGKKKLSRQDVVSRMWRYIKKKQLQDPNQRTTILCDEKLRALTKKPSIAQSDMLLCIGSHLTLIN